ncbi:MAG: hypothetical protein ACE5EQ_00805 [Phycisphaerae bacterium]
MDSVKSQSNSKCADASSSTIPVTTSQQLTSLETRNSKLESQIENPPRSPSREHTLIVAPYPGEFGWELMNWQGRVRWMARHGGFDRTFVCTTPDRRPLYTDNHSDGGIIFCPMPPSALPGEANQDHRIDSTGHRIDPVELNTLIKTQVLKQCESLEINSLSARLFMPDFRSAIWPTTHTHQAFVNLRVKSRITTDILLIQRYRSIAQDRNQAPSWWDELAERLRACGLKVETYQPRVDTAIVQLSRARLAVGASTGGLHLAALCGCPHYVWGSGPEARWTAMGITNRQRYETVWNPLGTPCRYDECGWKPGLDHVLEQARRSLDEIGIGAGHRVGRQWMHSKWRIKRGFARVLETSGDGMPWPWRLRTLVRQHLV